MRGLRESREIRALGSLFSSSVSKLDVEEGSHESDTNNLVNEGRATAIAAAETRGNDGKIVHTVDVMATVTRTSSLLFSVPEASVYRQMLVDRCLSIDRCFRNGKEKRTCSRFDRDGQKLDFNPDMKRHVYEIRSYLSDAAVVAGAQPSAFSLGL